jgi:hypothetical protein
MFVVTFGQCNLCPDINLMCVKIAGTTKIFQFPGSWANGKKIFLIHEPLISMADVLRPSFLYTSRTMSTHVTVLNCRWAYGKKSGLHSPENFD